MSVVAGKPLQREPMAAVQVRLPREFVNWLLDQAAEDGTTLSDEIRSCIAAAIVNAGDAERYGIDVDEDQS
jgi:hypothetical protein